MSGNIMVKNCVIQDEMKYNEEVVLSYKIQYPQFSSECYEGALNSVNKYYLNKALEYERYYRKELYKSAVEQYLYAKKNDYPIRVFEALVEYKVTYNMDCILSLYTDNYIYLGGAHGNTVRTSETWNLQRNCKLMLDDLFRCPFDYRSYILNIVNDEIQIDSSIYFDNYKKLTADTFDSQHFYCIHKGIVIYYQQYDIAPYSSGIREFLIPYNDCIINPYKLCCVKLYL